MKKKVPAFPEAYPRLLSALLFAWLAAYYAYCFFLYAFTAIPSEDFIGNFRPFAENILEGRPAAAENKLFPVYPLLLAGVSRLIPAGAGDAVYWAALLINLLFIFPFLFFAGRLFISFLGRRLAFIALLFLGVNLYTLYSLLNPELEVFLCFISCLSLYLMQKNNAASAIGAGVTAAVKGDCLFMIPAAAVCAYKRKGIMAGAAAGLAAAFPVCLYFAFRLLYGAGGNTYVAEVAERGPNIWKYPVECILASAGFPKWALFSAYTNGSTLGSAALCLAAIIFTLLAAAGLVLGIRAMLKLKADKLPLVIFAGGYILIHILYQNTKDRYVVPILWVLILLICLGAKSIYPRLERLLRKKAVLLTALACLMDLYALALLVLKADIALVLFAVTLHCLVFAFFMSQDIGKSLPVCLLLCALCSLNIGFGRDAMLHFGQRRIEFKEAALWFRENAKPGELILLTDGSVFGYYAGNRSIVTTGELAASNSSTTEELLEELSQKRISYCLIDDFYISRLYAEDPNAVSRKPLIKSCIALLSAGDPNAVSRKAPLMLRLRGDAPNIKRLMPVRAFKTHTGSYAVLYRYGH